MPKLDAKTILTVLGPLFLLLAAWQWWLLGRLPPRGRAWLWVGLLFSATSAWLWWHQPPAT